jgi:hypothetical protein
MTPARFLQAVPPATAKGLGESLRNYIVWLSDLYGSVRYIFDNVAQERAL